jgi:hypothetical protein
VPPNEYIPDNVRVDLPTPRDDRQDPSLFRATDRGRRALRHVQVVLGLLAIAVAVLVGGAVAHHEDSGPAPGTVVVQAELLEASPLPEAAVLNSTLTTRVRWTAPDGVEHTGRLPIEAGLSKGALVPVAVDAQGTVVDARLDEKDPVRTGLAAGLGALLCCWAVLTLAVSMCRARLDAIDVEDWETGWARVEPQWSGRAG